MTKQEIIDNLKKELRCREAVCYEEFCEGCDYYAENLDEALKEAIKILEGDNT